MTANHDQENLPMESPWRSVPPLPADSRPVRSPRSYGTPRPPAVGPGWLRGLLDQHGAQLLFCCSAVCVLYGMLRILGPLLLLDGALSRKLPAFGALNVYEVSIFAVLSLIVLWRGKLSEAPLLVALTAVFATAIGLALDTLAIDSVSVGFALGGACLFLGAAKLGYLRTIIRVRLDAWLLAASGILLTGTFLGSGAMARTLTHSPCDANALATTWRYGVLAAVAAGGLLWAWAAKLTSGNVGDGAALLHRPAMAWSIPILLLAGATVHACSLGYIFDVGYAWPDFLPLTVITAGLVTEVLRLRGTDRGTLPAVAWAVPIAAGGWVALSRQFTLLPFGQAGFLWHPTSVVLAASLSALWRTYRSGCRQLLTVGVAGLFLVVLTVGVTPTSATQAFGGLNWTPFWLATGAMLLAAGIVGDAVWVAMAGAIALSLTASFTWLPSGQSVALGLRCSGGVAVLLGVALSIVSMVFGYRTPGKLAVFAALCLALGIWWLDVPWMSWPRAAWSAFAVVTGIALWYRTGSRLALGILATPLARLLYGACRLAEGWSYVAAGFVLLFVGAVVAMLRNGAPVAATSGRS